ncbi:alkaline phosphatase [Marivirga lumbricoides]|uniref:Alkaline phosphatase n=2 Tax=Marivirga lumbricoides TaxID=1046115 RepID=A0ABQ1MI45_9BACT|nr:alkaline phosphatase [Marivirga lumbricoides]
MFSLLPFSFLLSCTKNGGDQQENHKKEKSENPNVILLIGDGMGLSQVTSLYYFKEGEPNLSRFENIGLSKTASSSHKITDSGASGSAMATGQKTYNGAIGVNKDTTDIENMVELLSKRGYHTGIIATSTITHATPASFFAHSKDRGMEDFIAAQLHNTEVDFFAGGGLKNFNKRIDGINYLDSLKTKNFSIDTTSLNAELVQKDKIGFLLSDGAMPKKLEGRDEFLPEATELSINFLKQKEGPFFIMSEGSQIDWGGHDNNSDYIITEIIDFDKVIGLALDFAEKDGNTLVIVTADHETGGYTLRSGKNEEGKTDYNIIDPSFSTSGHSATMVPVFAYGPGSEKFRGIYENTEIFHKIKEITAE